MKYNIGFTLGDPSADGHSVDYHMVSNYSALEIDRAYTNTTKILGFNLSKMSEMNLKVTIGCQKILLQSF